MKLYILVSDGGDGSYYPRYVVDSAVIDRMSELYDQGVLDYENGYGIDGDGFHCDTVNVQDTWVEDNPQEKPITLEDVENMIN